MVVFTAKCLNSLWILENQQTFWVVALANRLRIQCAFSQLFVLWSMSFCVECVKELLDVLVGHVASRLLVAGGRVGRRGVRCRRGWEDGFQGPASSLAGLRVT